MNYKLLSLSVLLIVSACRTEYDADSKYENFSPDGIPFCIADDPWEVEGRGFHRAVVEVAEDNADAVCAVLPWRRPDLRQELKKVTVYESVNGTEIKNVSVICADPEKGTIAFEPQEGCHIYHIYYLACHLREGYGDARYGRPWNDYLEPDYDADTTWLSSLDRDLPGAKVLRFEDLTRFDSFGPMGLIATEEESAALKSYASEGMLVFPEDRAFPIKLTHALPSRWAGKTPSRDFAGTASRNEYYCWQFGVWAAGKPLDNVKISFNGLKCGKSMIPPSEITCFNMGGTNWDGQSVEFRVDVPEGEVQALWCGVQIPRGAKPGTYRGTATLSADGVAPQDFKLKIDVSRKVIEDKGDSELWRHSRLRWLNSTIGIDDSPTKDFPPMSLEGRKIGAGGKTVLVGDDGMIESIGLNGKQILKAPMKFVVAMADGRELGFKPDNLKLARPADGKVEWSASSECDGISLTLEAAMEFDGFIRYDVGVSSESSIEVADVRVVSEYTPYASEYFMGIGYSGGFRPARHIWDWTGPYDSYWIGNELAGLHFEFLGGSYHGPLLNDYKPAPSPLWYNGGAGRVSVTGAVGDAATVVASTGKITLSPEASHFQFDMNITPARNVDTARQFGMRFFHDDPRSMHNAVENGANIANIHHATRLNPYINYPFLVRDSLVQFINQQHDSGNKVKLYYTIRELTTHCEEVFAFKSLKHEIFAPGIGYGLPWECEHLVDDYKPAWYTYLGNGDCDAALVTSGFSRFINYWLEGLRWMCENYGIDGIYMDDVSFDRFTVKRIRKVLDSTRDGALIDLHSNTNYSKGPANQYTDFFPFIDRLWFGESFRYYTMAPDEWFVTFSGIPFGLMSEMLQDGGNRFLGAVYGSTARYNVDNVVPVWKEWKDFGIEESRMIGYWSPDCPVTSSDPDVKVTVFAKERKALLAIGNFGDRHKDVRLTIDFKALGIDPSTATLRADGIYNFQEEASFSLDAPLPVSPKRGYLLILE